MLATQNQATQDARPTGLPKTIAWTFNFDAGWGSFGFANSLFTNPKEPKQFAYGMVYVAYSY